MPVNSTHPEYDAALPAWQRARDLMSGEDAVKLRGESYVPRLAGNTDAEYDAYLNRALFFNATGRTADAYIGLILRRAPVVRLPDAASAVGKSMSAFCADADLRGTSLTDYARDVVSEVIAVGRCGSLVDWEGEHEHRAYVSRYPAESILNWRVERLAGRPTLTLVVLHEPQAGPEIQGSDDFVKIVGGQIRVLRLVPASAGRGQSCQVEVWHRENGGEWKLHDKRVLLRQGVPLSRIPFVFHGPRHSLPDVDQVPLSDVIAVNLDHFRLDADFKHGMHFTALPTAWVSGFDRESTLRIGSSTAWTSETVGATAGFLEYKGQGLRTFERCQDRDERLMAVLGARLLESSKKVGETAEAIELRQAGENSILGNLAMSVSASLTHVLSWVSWWHSTEVSPDVSAHSQVSVELNTDYSLKGMSGEEITALVSAWQAGALSRNTMLDLFRRGELLPDDLTNEEESKLLDAESEKRRSEMKDVNDAGSFSNTPKTSRRN